MSAPTAGTALFIAPRNGRSSETYLMLESLLIRLDTLPWDIVQRYPLTSPTALPLLAPSPLAAFTSVLVGGMLYWMTTFTVVPEGTSCRSFDIFEDCPSLHDAVSSTRSRTAVRLPHAALRLIL